MPTHKQRILAALKGEMPDTLPYVPRIDLWYNANLAFDTLPKQHRGRTQDEISRAQGWALGADQWAPDIIRGADRILTAIDSRPHPPRAPLARTGIAQEIHFLRREHDQLLLDAVRAASTARPSLVQTDSAHRATRDRIEAILDIVASAAIVGPT